MSASPRWRKLIGDARAARGRLVLLCVAMSLSVLAVTTVLVANGILRREFPRSYADSHPPSAILRMDEIDAELVRAVLARPGIKAASRSGVMSATIETRDGEWLPLDLTIIAELDALQIDTFDRQSGQWPPGSGALLIERSGIGLLGITDGATVKVATAQGPQTLVVSGQVHDQGKPPSTQEMLVYGYITPATMQTLDSSERIDRLKIVVAKEGASAADIEAIARPLALWLRERGHQVHSIDIPPPGKHPHQWQYDAISLLLLAFSLLGLLLESTLLAIVISGLLAPQVRQIAVMKAIGARTRQITMLYLSLVGALAGAVVAIALPIGLLLAYALVDFVARVVNIAIESYSVPWWTIALSACLGLATPLIAALIPIVAASRKSIRESLDDHGVAAGGSTKRLTQWRWADTPPARLRSSDGIVNLAIRNTLRRKTRLVLTLSLLTIAGVVFLVGGNLLSVWQGVVAGAAKERRFDMQVALRTAQDRVALLDVVRSVRDVQAAETGDARTAHVDRGDALTVTGAGRNVFGLRFIPAQTRMMSLVLAEGRWLEPQDKDAIVLNTVARKSVFPTIAIGDTVALLVDSRPLRLRVVGIALEQFSGAAAYTTPAVLDAFSKNPGTSQGIRIAVTEGASPHAVAASLRQRLEQAGMPVSYIATAQNAAKAEAAHVYVLIALLGVIVAGVGTVGAAGLASAIGTSVVERTREFAIMRAIGARTRHILKSVITEAMVIGSVSWLLAVVVSIPLTLLTMDRLRTVVVQPLVLDWSQSAAVAWLAIALGVAAIASVYPARRAARFRVTAALAHN